MPRARIDRRPQVYCAHCYKFGGVHVESRFCSCCGGPLNNRRVNVRDLCEANLVAYNEKRFIWACMTVLEMAVAVLGYTFKELQNYNVVDIAYYASLALVPIVTHWYIKKYVEPRHPAVFKNIFFRAGIPESPPRERMGLGTDW